MMFDQKMFNFKRTLNTVAVAHLRKFALQQCDIDFL